MAHSLFPHGHAALVTALDEYLEEDFERACQQLLDCDGRVVVTGMQLSGMSAIVVMPPAAAARVAVS